MGKKSEFEERMDRIDELNNLLNDDSLDFDKMVEYYEEAINNIAECKKLIDGYEAKIEELTARGKKALELKDNNDD